MKFLFLTMFLTFSVSALAESYYGRVKTLFDQGIKPAKEELLGINAGRCFLRDDPYQAKAGLLYARVDNTNAGPIDDETIVGVLQWSESKDAKYYETAAIHKILADISDALPVRDNSSSLLLDNYVGGERNVVTYEVRKNGTYLVSRIGTFMYCYTFTKR